MPRDFKSFSNKTEKENILKNNNEKVEEYNDILNKYKNMDNSELMQNLFSEASKLKQQGKLDSNTLNNLQSTLNPFLNSDQKEMLTNLVNAINEQK